MPQRQSLNRSRTKSGNFGEMEIPLHWPSPKFSSLSFLLRHLSSRIDRLSLYLPCKIWQDIDWPLELGQEGVLAPSVCSVTVHLVIQYPSFVSLIANAGPLAPIPKKLVNLPQKLSTSSWKRGKDPEILKFEFPRNIHRKPICEHGASITWCDLFRPKKCLENDRNYHITSHLEPPK